MDMPMELKILYTKEGKTQGDVAKILGTTQANLSKKFKNNSFYWRDIEGIINGLGYEIKIEFIKK